jgi:CRISPR/Cas system-associated protein Csx1
MKKNFLIGIITLIALIIVGISLLMRQYFLKKTILENFIRENLKEVYLPPFCIFSRVQKINKVFSFPKNYLPIIASIKNMKGQIRNSNP